MVSTRSRLSMLEFWGSVNFPLRSGQNLNPNLCHRLSLSLVFASFVHASPSDPGHLTSKFPITGGPEVKVWMIQHKPVFTTRQEAHIMFVSLFRGVGVFSSFSDSLVSPLPVPSCFKSWHSLFQHFLNMLRGTSDSDSLRGWGVEICVLRKHPKLFRRTWNHCFGTS